MSRAGLQGLLAGFLVVLVSAAAAFAGGLSPNPANHRTLLHDPIEDFRYDYAERCTRDEQRGTRALESWLERNLRGESWGILRCERLGRGNFSLHAEGRALDWRLDAGDRDEKRAAMHLIRSLLERDRNGAPAALARRMGVQGLIFNCRSWWSGQQGLDRYPYCYRPNGERRDDLDRTAAHKDHVHIELNWPGARKRTSFWRSPLADR